MSILSKPAINTHGLGLIIILSLSGVVLAQLPTAATAPQNGQSAASYRARMRAVERAQAEAAAEGAVLERRRGESEASLQARVRAAERARIAAADRRIPVERRRGESEASYQARIRAAERARIAAVAGSFALERRRGESEASYQARVRAAERARAVAARRHDMSLSPSLLEKQPEADAAYQIRLRRTIQGLLTLLSPEPKIDIRRGESDASYDARCRAASRAQASLLCHLIARPGEDQAAYQNRLQTWREAQPTPRGTHRPRVADPDADSAALSDPREESLAPQH